jgi:SAM-dependent methyltransferase
MKPRQDELFRRLPEPEHGPMLPVLVSYLFSLAGLLRLCDFVLLLWRPRLLRASLAALLTSFQKTPWANGSFDKIHDARKRQKSLVELTYGETPTCTAVRVLRRAGVRQGSTLLDLGCGRGRVLLAARYLGADAVGVELLEAHVDAVGEILARVGAEVRLGDAEQTSLAGITHVFLAWTCFSAETRRRIEARLEGLEAGARVVTLNLAMSSPSFAPVLQTKALCSWGRVPVFVCERRPAR